ncbi:MAG TPA: alpha-L-fucosidase, partial [Tichowtungia sp.]|nr:alpha-L-fucosidase [Tichowtungia sp.]
MTMNHTWGYKVNDTDWKPVEELIHRLCDIVSKGGNFLLNIGPKADGTIPQASVDRLKTIGQWMDVNSESIYGTSANPFHRLPWGRATKKIRENGVTLYLQVFDWPENGKLTVPGLQNSPESVTLLAGGGELGSQVQNGSLVIDVPETAPDPIVSVIRLDIEGELNIDPVMPEQDADGRIELTPAFADLHNSRSHGQETVLENIHGKTIIGQWTHDRAWMSWTFEVKQPGTFSVFAEIFADSESNLAVALRDSDATEIAIPATKGDFEVQELGRISIAEPGVHHLEFRPVRDQWTPVSLGNVILKPVNK